MRGAVAILATGFLLYKAYGVARACPAWLAYRVYAAARSYRVLILLESVGVLSGF